MSEPVPSGDLPEAGPLPDFLIIGAPKAGTSALYVLLGDHPQVFISEKKELDFFTLEHHRGERWYRSRFAAGAAASARGEATPHYLASPDAIRRAHDLVPDARLIALLRDPVDRAYSHYWMQMAKFPDQRPSVRRFVELTRAEARDVDGYRPEAPHQRYLWNSLYGRHLDDVRSVYPADQVLAILQEDLRDAPQPTLDRVCRFLGVEPGHRPAALGADVNPGTRVHSTALLRLMLRTHAWERLPLRLGYAIDRLNRVKGYPRLPDRDRADLLAWFEPDLARLAAAGLDTSRWTG
ncbi:MAG: sulfotransferase family protein [Acidimicrobiales bacterium]